MKKVGENFDPFTKSWFRPCIRRQ